MWPLAQMKHTVLLVLLILGGQAFAQSKYGLNCAEGTCATVDQKAEERMAAAKTICSSDSSTVSYRKDSKPNASEMSYHWGNINAASEIAERGYALAACTQADLVIRLDVDLFVSDNVSINVTDADSGESVFMENRSIQAERNDLARLAMHFHDAAMAAKTAERERKRQAEIAEQLREESENAAKEARRCDQQYDYLRSLIIDIMGRQHGELPPETLAEIADHNEKCRSSIVPERVLAQAKAAEQARLSSEAEAKRREAEEKKRAEEKAAAEAEEEAEVSQRNARFATVREQALAQLQQRTASTPFVPVDPGGGWMQVANYGPSEARYYIVLFNDKGASQDCHFILTGKQSPDAAYALDCLQHGRNPYFLVTSNNRTYALQSSKTPSGGTYAGQVKDNGRTICLRGAGCHQVLAEIRPAPTALPDTPEVPAPSVSRITYKGFGIQFVYPSNWATEEHKRNNTVSSLVVAPPEARFGSWVTHGLFIGHSEKTDQAATLEAAFNTFAGNFHKNSGLKLESDKTALTIDGQRGLMATYSAASIFSAGEFGYLVVFKDKSDGYFWFLMFRPGIDSTQRYQRLFMEILSSVKFE